MLLKLLGEPANESTLKTQPGTTNFEFGNDSKGLNAAYFILFT